MDYDVIIIGSGPAGYVAALRASQLGMKTAIIEKKDIGGMCLNWGCIPTKAILESAKFYKKIRAAETFGITGINQESLEFNWHKVRQRAKSVSKKITGGIEHLFKKNAVEVIIGEAKIVSENEVSVNNRVISAKNIVIATGSYPRPLDASIDKSNYLEVEHLLDLDELPKKVLVVGRGPVSIELVQFFTLIGSQIIYLLENEEIIPRADAFVNHYLMDKLKADGVKVLVKKEFKLKAKNILSIDGDDYEFDLIINAKRRSAILPPSTIDFELTDDKFIKTDDELKTNYKSVYAIGDVNGRSFLAHVGSAQGMFVINNIQGVKGAMNYKIYPLNIYTVPEIAQIGLTEQEVLEQKIPYKISQYPFNVNSKAMIEGNTEGMVRIISDKIFGEVLGVQIIGANATDMISEAAAYIEMEATVYDVSKTIHAHPTISEVFLEAGFEATDKPINR